MRTATLGHVVPVTPRAARPRSVSCRPGPPTVVAVEDRPAAVAVPESCAHSSPVAAQRPAVRVRGDLAKCSKRAVQRPGPAVVAARQESCTPTAPRTSSKTGPQYRNWPSTPLGRPRATSQRGGRQAKGPWPCAAPSTLVGPKDHWLGSSAEGTGRHEGTDCHKAGPGRAAQLRDGGGASWCREIPPGQAIVTGGQHGGPWRRLRSFGPTLLQAAL